MTEIRRPQILLNVHGPESNRALKPAPWRLGSPTSELMGTRRFDFPFLAAKVKTHMGPCRHVLSQMVVAGVMRHQPPIRIMVEKSENSSGTA